MPLHIPIKIKFDISVKDNKEVVMTAEGTESTLSLKKMCDSCRKSLDSELNKFKFYAIEFCDECWKNVEDQLVAAVKATNGNYVQAANKILADIETLKAKGFLTDSLTVAENILLPAAEEVAQQALQQASAPAVQQPVSQ